MTAHAMTNNTLEIPPFCSELCSWTQQDKRAENCAKSRDGMLTSYLSCADCVSSHNTANQGGARTIIDLAWIKFVDDCTGGGSVSPNNNTLPVPAEPPEERVKSPHATAVAEGGRSNYERNPAPIIVGSVVGTVLGLMLLALLGFVFLRCRRRNRRQGHESSGLDGQQQKWEKSGLDNTPKVQVNELDGERGKAELGGKSKEVELDAGQCRAELDVGSLSSPRQEGNDSPTVMGSGAVSAMARFSLLRKSMLP